AEPPGRARRRAPRRVRDPPGTQQRAVDGTGRGRARGMDVAPESAGRTGDDGPAGPRARAPGPRRTGRAAGARSRRRARGGHAGGGGAAITWRAAPLDADLVLAATGRGAFVYDAQLFERATIARLAGHLGMLLEHLELDTLVEKLPLVTAAEARWLDEVSRS